MKKILLIWILVAMPLGPSIARAESACTRTCSEAEIENVQVLFGPPDVDTRLQRLMARKWYSKARGADDLATIQQAADNGRNLGLKIVMDNPYDLRAKILELANDCKRIKFLGFFSHGHLGSVSFGKTGMDARNVDSVMEGLDCAMADDATVYFGGCNVGRGCRGEQFLALVADNLLKKGGRVRANTNYSSTFAPGLVAHTSLNGDTQILKVKAGPELSGWDNSPQSLQACRKRISDAQHRLDNLKTQMATCLSYNPYGIPQTTLDLIPEGNRQINQAKEALLWAEVHERKLAEVGAPHSGFTEAHRTAAKHFRSAFYEYHAVMDTFGGIGPCIGCNSGGCHSNNGHKSRQRFDLVAPEGVHQSQSSGLLKPFPSQTAF